MGRFVAIVICVLAGATALCAGEVAATTVATTVEVVAGAAVSAAQTGPYTGLVIDCRGLNISRSMSPQIQDVDAHEIWGFVKMDYAEALERGKVGYYKSLEQAKTSRVGSNPLVVKAVAISGNKNYPSDPVLTLADGAVVTAAAKESGFFDAYKVGFLVD